MSECSLITLVRVTPRATPMPPDDRRKAIVSVLVPLHRRAGRRGEHPRDRAGSGHRRRAPSSGSSPTRGACCWRPPRRRSTPPTGRRSSTRRWPASRTCARRSCVAAGRVLERMHLTMSVMVAVRPHLLRHPRGARARGTEAVRAAAVRAQGPGGPAPAADRPLRAAPRRARRRARGGRARAAQPDLRRQPTRARDEAPALDAEQIADLVLDGVLTRGEPDAATGSCASGSRRTAGSWPPWSSCSSSAWWRCSTCPA